MRRSARSRLAALSVLTLLVSGLPNVAATTVSQAASPPATYSATQTIPVPPASNFVSPGGGDGWAVALTATDVFNIFHYYGSVTVACHHQVDGSSCYTPMQVRDDNGHYFASSAEPGIWIDPATEKLYTFATRDDSTAGVLCFDTKRAAAGTAPFCGFNALSAVGDASIGSTSEMGTIARVGTKVYAFNFSPGQAAVGARNKLLCFDTATLAACPSQPFALNYSADPNAVVQSSAPEPAMAAIAGKLIVPIQLTAGDVLACFDPATTGTCTGAWPVASGSYRSTGGPYPLLNATGTTTGLCLPEGSNPCFDLAGATVGTPSGLGATIGDTMLYNGPAFALGPRVYVPNGNANTVECYDFVSGSSCANFPKSFVNLFRVYTVNPDPQRPTCLWVNADDGSAQIQNFDAYTGGACGQGAIRVLASSFVVPSQLCQPATYTSLQVVAPVRSGYGSGSVAFEDSDANPVAGMSDLQVDATGAVDLSALHLPTSAGLPQFLISLTGTQGAPAAVQVKLTWTGVDDPTCAAAGTTVLHAQTNRPPVAKAGGPYAVDEGGSLQLDGSASSDPDSDQLTYAWDVNGDGTYDSSTAVTTFDASAMDGPSTHHATLQVCDTSAACSTSVATITVRNVAPTVKLRHDWAVFRGTDLPLSGAWADPAGSLDEKYAWSWVANGTTTTGTAVAGASAVAHRTSATAGSYNASLTVTDKDNGSGTAPANVLVLNQPPSCSGLKTNVTSLWPPSHKMAPITITGASDPEGDPLTVTVVQITQDETITGAGSGHTSPDATGVGTSAPSVLSERSGTGDGRVYHLAVKASDGAGASCYRDLTVTVPHDQNKPAVDSCVSYDSLTGVKLASKPSTPSNLFPSSLATSVAAVTATTREDTSVVLPLSAVNLPGTNPSFRVLGVGPVHGDITIGTTTCVASGDGRRCTASATFVPAQDFAGTDDFDIVGTDGTNGWVGHAHITITAVNDPPVVVASPHAVHVVEDSAPVAVALTATDVDSPVASIVMHVATLPAHGTLRRNGVVVTTTDNLGSSAGLTYAPAANYNGSDSFVISGTDGTGATGTSTLTVPVTVDAVNDAPTGAAVSVTTAEDTGVDVPIAVADIDSPSLSFSLAGGTIAGALGTFTTPVCHTAGAGTSCTTSVHFTPKANSSGGVDFSVVVGDGQSSTSIPVHITVTPVNDPPSVTVNPAALTVAEDSSPASIILLASDVETAGSALVFRLTAAAKHGTVRNGSATLNAGDTFSGPTASLTYQPGPDYNGADSLTLTVTDTGDGSDGPITVTKVVPITVTAVDDPPVMKSVHVSVAEDGSVLVHLVATDIDSGSLTFSSNTSPSRGTLSPFSAAACSTTGGLTTCTTDTTYTPTHDLNGNDSFIAGVSDGTTTVLATVIATVTPVNDAPITADDAVVVTQGHAFSFSADLLAGNDTPGPTDEAGQQLTVTSVTAGAATHGTVSLAARQVTYTSESSYVGPASFSYQVCDDGQTNGQADPRCSTGTVNVDVRHHNAPPSAGTATVTVGSGTPVAVTLVGSDADADPLSFTVSDPAHGSLGPVSQPTCNAAGDCTATVTYISAAGYSGPDSFAYRVSDGVATTTGGVTITVNPVATATPTPSGGPSATPTPSTGPTGTPTPTPTGSTTPPTSGPAPTVGGVSPLDGSRVTAPTPVKATIAPPAGGAIATWAVTVTPVGGGTSILLGHGQGDAPATLATVDPTVLANGAYRIDVTATTTDNGTQNTESTVIVDGNLKLGRFAATWHDTDASLGSTTLGMLRSYDSDVKRSGDFGYGWSLSTSGIKVSTNRALGDGGWSSFDASCVFSICTEGYKTSKPHVVVVTFPDGHVEIFDFTPVGAPSTPFLAYARFTARAGTTSTLTPVGDDNLLDQGDGSLYDEESGDPYAPTQFVLTTHDGNKLLLDTTQGLVSFTNPAGITYTFTPTGVTSSAGGNTAVFTRDSAGRITDIKADGHTSYSYSAAGDLASETDPAGAVTTFTYDSAHLLLSVNGPGNVPLRTMHYDTAGRLTSVTDADGNTTAMTDDVAARTQVIKDPNGKLTTTLHLDDLGDVLTKTAVGDGQTRTTTSTYDAFGRVLSSADPLGHTTSRTYDDAGDLLSATDAAGHVRSITYGPTGQPLTTTDATGGVQHFGYDGSSELTSLTDANGNTTSYSYDAAGRMASKTDAMGGTTSYGYDGAGRVTSSTDPLGRTTTTTYDSHGHVATSTDPAGLVTTTSYDPDGRLLSTTDPSGAVTMSAYDGNGHQTSMTDALGKATSYAYTAAGLRSTSTDPLGRATGFGYDADGRVTATTDPTGAATTSAYDAFGELASVKDALGRVTGYGYDAAGERTSMTAANGKTTSYGFDVAGNRTTVTDPLGHVTTTAHDAMNRPTTVTDADGHVTKTVYLAGGQASRVTDAAGGVANYSYDADNRVTGTTDALSESSSSVFDAAGQLTSSVDAAGRGSSSTYDGDGRVLTSTDGAGRVSSYSYDTAGRLATVTSPSGRVTSYGYDAAGRQTSVTDNLGHSTATAYDAAGETASSTDPNGHAASYGYDGAGRMTSMTDALGGTVSLGYDAAGQQTKVTDPDGVVHSYGFDALGDRSSVTDALGDVQSSVFDDAGQLKSAKNARGQVTTYSYDAAGQTTGWSSPDGTVSQGFDALGDRTSVTDATGSSTYSFDAVGRMTGATTPAGTVSYGYDASGLRTDVTAAAAHVGYAYNGAGQLASVADASGTTSMGYTTDGDLASVTRPNGVATAYGYDAAGRLVKDDTTKGTTVVANIDYTLDAAGNRVGVTGPDGAQSYTLDADNRLTAATGGGAANLSYSYDAAGNRTSVTSGSATTGYAYDAAGRLSKVGATAVSMDADGNLTTAGGDTYTYNAAGALTAATVGGTAATYAVNADGARVAVTTGGATSKLVLDVASDLPAVLAETGHRYTRDTSGGLLADAAGTTTSYAVTDAQGTVRALTSTTGTVTGTANYDPYGQLRTSTGTATSFGYTGAATDVGGNVNLQAREYNAGYGQFLEADTYTVGGDGTVGYNHYTYTGDNPTTAMDLRGHDWSLASTLGSIGINTDLLDVALLKTIGVLALVGGVAGAATLTGTELAKVRESLADHEIWLFKAGGRGFQSWTPRPDRDVEHWPQNGLSFWVTPELALENGNSTKTMRVSVSQVESIPGLQAVPDLDPAKLGHWFVTGATEGILKEWAATRDTAKDAPSSWTTTLIMFAVFNEEDGGL